MDEGVVAALAWNHGGSGEGGDRKSQTCGEHLPGPEPCAKYFSYFFVLFIAARESRNNFIYISISEDAET